MRNVFAQARQAATNEVLDDLADFRKTRELGELQRHSHKPKLAGYSYCS